MKKTLLFMALTAFSAQLYAQNVKSEDVEYRHIRLPLTPLPSTIKNYQSTVFAAYEAENAKKQAEYNAAMDKAELEYQREKAAYPAKVKAAEDKYAAEMAEWEKKSMAEKVVEKQVLKENNKPVKQIPSEPYKAYVQPPVLQTSYDYPALASTYLGLDGFTNNPQQAVKIEVTLYGFDYTHPRQLTEQKSKVYASNGSTTTRQVTYYHTEFTYRHTMSVKVTGPDGKELFFLTPQELNTYKIYKSAETETPAAVNEQQLVKTHEEKILQENLKFISDLVNDKIGYRRATRKTSLSFVKTKDDTYQDLLVAYNDANSGLKLLVDDPQAANTKLNSAVAGWENAMKESDVNNKKARIDKEVTTMIYFNLLEAYFALNNTAGADKVMASLNTLSLSNSDRKQKEAYEILFNDLKKRLEANK